MPFQLNGNWLAQIVVLVMLVTASFTTRFRVAMESQPAALMSFTSYEPAAVKLLPFQLNGNWLAQITMSVELVTASFTTRLRVAIESQPAALVNLTS